MLSNFSKPCLIGIIADVNQGKSNLVYSLIKQLSSRFKFNLYTYGLRNFVGGKQFYSITELENIKDGLIFIDEFFNLFDLEDRNKKRQIEQTLRLLHHNNNILVLIGLPENFKKFISGKLGVIFYKKVTFSDFINGSSVKKTILDYKGNEVGSSVLNINQNETLVYNGEWNKYDIEYLKDCDTKINNRPILEKRKNVEKTSEKRRENVEKTSEKRFLSVRKKKCRENVGENVEKTLVKTLEIKK